MKKLIFTALLAVLLYTPVSADAWQVKVRNSMRERFNVTLHYGLPLLGGINNAWIEPQSTHTFDIGLQCPRALTGCDSSGWDLMGTDMHGTWYGSLAPSLALISCANFNIIICDMPNGSSEHYSFCIDR